MGNLRRMAAVAAAAGLVGGVLGLVGPGLASADPAPGDTVSSQCTATAVAVQDQSIAVANPAGSPCAADSVAVARTNHGGVHATGLASSTGSTATSASAASRAESVKITVPGYGAVTITGAATTATSNLGATCGAGTPSGTSTVASVTAKGHTTVVGSAPSTISLGRFGDLYVNQSVVDGSAITERAVFVDLAGTASDLVIAESTAAIDCTPAPPETGFSWLGPQPSTPSTGTPVPVTLCDQSSGHLHGVTVALEPTTEGTDIAVSGTPDETITDGSLTWSLTFDGIPISSGTQPLSSVMTLPRAAGTLVVWRAALHDLPSGSYTLQVSATDQGGSALTCLSATFDL